VVRWFSDSFSNVVDIQAQGWRHEVKPARWLTPVLVFLLIVGIVYGFLYDKHKFAANRESRLRLYIMMIALFFVGVHLMVNYGEYKHYKVFGIALNGRYIIPSLLPLIIFAGFYWSKLLARYPKLLVVLAIIVALGTIFGSGLLMMFRNPQLIHG
jgi:hypothetical protein